MVSLVIEREVTRLNKRECRREGRTVNAQRKMQQTGPAGMLQHSKQRALPETLTLMLETLFTHIAKSEIACSEAGRG